MDDPPYQRFTVRAQVPVEDLRPDLDVFKLLPPLPPIPSPDGQLCRLCGAPATAVEVQPLQFDTQDDLASDILMLRAIQKYRFVCESPHP